MASFALKEALNRFFENGIEFYIKKDVGAFGANDWKRIEQCLKDWQSRGLVRILKPVAEAEPDDIVIQVLGFIDLKEI